MRRKFRPFKNENGFTVIILVALISVTVISYSLYAANYFLILTSEVKNAKRLINGLNVLQQVGQSLIEPREEFFTNAGACVAPYDTAMHELCVKTATPPAKTDGICVRNPFLQPALLCLRNPVNPGSRNVIEVSTYKEPTFYDRVTHPLKRFNFEYGKSMVAMAERFSNRAMAYPDDALPGLAGAPEVRKDPNTGKTCVNNSLPSEECVRCRGGGPAGAEPARPECFTMKVCIRPDGFNGGALDGWGDCDPAINEQWIWQMIAVINYLGP